MSRVAAVDAGNDRLRERLGQFITRRAASSVSITALIPLPAGTARHAWGVDVAIDSGPFAGARRLIYLQDRGGRSLDSRLRREDEFGVLSVVHARGARVPRPYWHVGEEETEGLGSGLILERVDGETVARRILDDPALGPVRLRVLEQMGEELARIHAIPPDTVRGLAGPPAGRSAADAQLDEVEHMLAEIDEPHPALELGLRWLRPRAPASRPLVVVHGDYRLGNVVVGPGEGLRAILDWELVHAGDPGEDLGWMCMRFWQGVDHPGEPGLGPRRRFFDAYARVSGWRLDAELALYWEAFANLRWAVVTLRQARRHLDGWEQSLELASIGRRCAEVEWELLRLLRGR